MLTHQALVAKDHLENSGGHHLEKVVVEVVVEGHIKHQSILGVQNRSAFGVACSCLSKRHTATIQQSSDKFSPTYMMGALDPIM
jgi:UDP-2,3-diacylglucosamine pyrophosphatase LpxH